MNTPTDPKKEFSAEFNGLIERYKELIRMLASGLDAKTPQEDRDFLIKLVEPIIKGK